MCVVDFHRLYLNSIKRGATTIQECNVRKLADFIYHTLSGTNHKPGYTFLRHRVGNYTNLMKHLVRIQDRNGQTNRDPTVQNKFCGNPIANKCFVCIKYLQQNGMTQYKKTRWWFKFCKLPLCAVDRSKISNNKAKCMSYFVEHLSTYDPNNYIFCRAREYSRGKIPHQ